MHADLEIAVELMPSAEGLPLPSYATAGAAGLDLRAALSAPLVLPPMGRAAVPTGLRIAIPAGWEGQVRPRSGLALKHGLSMPNAPGTIDCDYRGELKVLLINLGPEPITIDHGMRVAQLVLCPVGRAALRQVPTLVLDTERGAGGFGSTGV